MKLGWTWKNWDVLLISPKTIVSESRETYPKLPRFLNVGKMWDKRSHETMTAFSM